jgi:alpha-beta hydrolase superfamily lysophospholipase
VPSKLPSSLSTTSPSAPPGTSPLFFTEKETFIQSLPHSLYFSDANKTNATCVASYLSHYRLNNIDPTLVDRHDIWQSTIDTIEDTYSIIQQHWRTSHKAQGTVVVAHGYLDHSGLYGQLIEWGLRQRYNVLCIDLPGHGLSSGTPASIKHFDTYTDVLEHVLLINQQTLQQPLIAVGQSTGCAIIANALLPKKQQVKPYEKQCEPSATDPHVTSRLFRHAIFLAPLVRSAHWSSLRYLYFLLKPAITSVQRKFVDSSHNPEFNHFLQYHDPLQAKKISLAWLGAMDEWYSTCKKVRAHHNTPLSIIQGTDDMTVDWHYNINALCHIFPNHSVYYVDGAKHHLVNESQDYWKTIEKQLTNIINQRLQTE